jgi:hypothetical protein
MAASLPDPTSFKQAWPLLLLVVVNAAHPAVGAPLVGVGLVLLWSQNAPGTWPWQARFWDAMQWMVASALGIVAVGVILHVAVVRPLWDALRETL